MSRTSLGRKNEQLTSKQVGIESIPMISFVRLDKIQDRSINLQEQEALIFKSFGDKYQRVKRETQYMNCEIGQSYSFIKDDFGKYMFENGDLYIGQWKFNKMQGIGQYTFYHPRKVYLGQFALGFFHGYGTLAQLQGSSWVIIYQGQWEKGEKHGQGVHFYQNGQIRYTGNWKNNQKQGFGTLNLPSAQYVGNWTGDQRQGKGKLSKLQRGINITYQGDWDKDELHQGTICYQVKDFVNSSKSRLLGKYRGHLRNGKKHGYGRYQWPAQNSSSQGIEYIGNFQNDCIRGTGEIIIGQFKFQGNFTAEDDTFGGPLIKGVITYESGGYFDGIISIRDGKVRREKGTYHFPNNDKAQGQFQDNEKGQVKGTFTYEWDNGETKQF